MFCIFIYLLVKVNINIRNKYADMSNVKYIIKTYIVENPRFSQLRSDMLRRVNRFLRNKRMLNLMKFS